MNALTAQHIAASYALRAAAIVHPTMNEKEFDRATAMDDHAAVWNRVAECLKLDAQAEIDRKETPHAEK